MDNTLLATSDKGMLYEVKQLLYKYKGYEGYKTSYVIRIKIHKERFRDMSDLSQETNINKFLVSFNIKGCSLSVTPMVNADRFEQIQCQKHDLEWEHVKNIPYNSNTKSLMYAQVCGRPDIAFVIEVLKRYLTNLGVRH